MIDRAIELKESLNRSLDAIPIELGEIFRAEWLLAEKLIQCFGPLEEATRTLCGDEYISASLIIPKIRSVINFLTCLVFISFKPVMEFRAHLVDNLKKRFVKAEECPTLCAATLLDPRFKEAGFTTKVSLSLAKETVTERGRKIKKRIDEKKQAKKFDPPSTV